MSQPNNYGLSPAYPMGPYAGLTKRELFAAMAMQTLCYSKQDTLFREIQEGEARIIASQAVFLADCLLDELAAKE